MANNREIEPKQVADLIYDYMDWIYWYMTYQSKSG